MSHPTIREIVTSDLQLTKDGLQSFHALRDDMSRPCKLKIINVLGHHAQKDGHYYQP